MTKKSQLVENQNEKITLPADILSELIKYSGLTGQKFAKKIGVSQSVVSEYLQGKYQKLSKKMEGAILETFPEVSLVWLLTGNGNMLKSVRVEGSGNATVNGDHSTATIGVDGSRLLDQLDRKDEQIKNATEQVNRLLAIIERMQGA